MDDEQEQEILDYDDPPQMDQDQSVQAEANQETVEVAPSGTDPLSMPPHGTEVFISKIPREATHPQLLAFCEKLGHKVHAIRLPKDPGNPGQNKGYAFAVYMETAGANETLLKLNQTELPDFPGRKVTIVRSEVKNKLFVGNIPREMDKEQVLETLKADVVGIVDMNLMVEKDNPNPTNVNRGFGFIEFFNNSAAELARRKLSAADYRLKKHSLTVTWAEPKKNDAMQEQVKSIYVGNLPGSVDDVKLKSIFSAYGKISQIVLLKDPNDSSKLRNYGFVHYEERSSALKAVEEAEDGPKPEMDGKELIVHMARPQPRDEVELTGRQGHRDVGRGAGGYAQGGGYPQGASRGVSAGYNTGRVAVGGGGYGYAPRVAQSGSGPPGGYGSGGVRVGGPASYAQGGVRVAAGGAGRGAYGGNSRAAPAAYYDEGGYDDGYGGGEEEYAEEYDYGYGGYGGYPAGMTMVPMMMPGGQVAYVMASQDVGGGGGSGGPPPRMQQPDPPPSGGPTRRLQPPPRDYGGGHERQSSGGYGSPAPRHSVPLPEGGRAYRSSGVSGGYGGSGSYGGVRSAYGDGGDGYASGRGREREVADYGDLRGEPRGEPRGGYGGSGRSAPVPERPSSSYGGGGREAGRSARYVPY